MKIRLIISLFALGTIGIGTVGAASAGTQWRYPYKVAPYAVPHTHTLEKSHVSTTAAHPDHRGPAKAIRPSPKG